MPPHPRKNETQKGKAPTSPATGSLPEGSVLDRIPRLEEKLNLIVEIHDKLAKIECLGEIHESIVFFNENFEDMKKLISNLQKENAFLRTENQELKKSVACLEQNLDDLESYNRRNNLEIINIPQRQGEETDKIVEKIAEILEVDLNPTEIEASHRIYSSRNETAKKSSPLIVRFVNRRVKEAFIKRAKSKKLSTKDLGFPGQVVPVFVRENLTRKKKELFYLALSEKRNTDWKFLWSHNGNIFARRKEGDKVYKICAKDDLHIFKETQ